MMYILSQEEFDNLKEENQKQSVALEETLQELCTRVANSEILKEGWMKGRVWGCVLTAEGEWYCDNCPVQELCPYKYKEWSK